MNIWERLARVFVKEQRDDVTETLDLLRKKEMEKAIEEKKETLDVVVKGTYGLKVTQGKYFCYRVMAHVDSKYIALEANAEAHIYIDNEVVTLKINKEERISEHYDLCYEDSIIINFMNKTDEVKEKLFKEGIEKMVNRTISEEKHKTLKEQFDKLKNVGFDIKITIPKDSIK